MRLKLKILLATNNKHKVSEFSRIFERYSDKIGDVTLLTLKDIDFTDEIIENGSTFEENSLIKADVGARLGYICIADDSGLAVDALGGAPGVYSARYAGEGHNDAENNKKLLNELEKTGDTDRKANFVCCISCAFPDGEHFTVRGECHGVIAKSLCGEGGFGYDPLFFVPSMNKTFAEMTPDEKNLISHRGVASEKFIRSFLEYAKERLK